MIDTSIDGGPAGAPLLADLLRRRRITPAHVARLRASEAGFGLRSLADAETMLAIERNGGTKCREWGDFFVEAMLDFLVWDEHPAGRLTADRATWLGDQVGDRPTPACMALLVGILDEAHEVPSGFHEAVRLRAARVFPRGQATSDTLAAA